MIEVKHSSIVIHNYKLGDCSKLEKLLSAWDNVSFNYIWQNFYYNEEDQTLIIPRGMDIKYIQYLFQDKELFVNKVPAKSNKATFTCTIEPRDKDQIDSINFLTDTTNSQKMLSLNTGEGKTYCTINALSQLKKRAMIIVDKDKIMQQWKSEILKFTDLEEDDIYLISGSQSINKIMDNKSDPNYKIFIASHRTLASYAGENWDAITRFFNKIKIGCKVFDEAHVEVKNIFMLDSFTNVAQTIYLTATPSRSNPLEDKVYQLSFKEMPKYGLENKFNEPHNIIYYISYDSKPEMSVVARCKTKRGFDTNTFSNYTFNQNYDQFFDIICKLLNITLKHSGKTTIILHKNDHIEKLKKNLEEVYEGIEIGIFSGLITNKNEREKELNKKIILSTDKSMGKAVDIKDLQFVIMTVPTSSKVVAEQTLGRLRKLPDGRNTIYFDLTDVGFKSCLNQRKSRRQLLDLKAKKIKLLNL